MKSRVRASASSPRSASKRRTHPPPQFQQNLARSSSARCVRRRRPAPRPADARNGPSDWRETGRAGDCLRRCGFRTLARGCRRRRQIPQRAPRPRPSARRQSQAQNHDRGAPAAAFPANARRWRRRAAPKTDRPRPAAATRVSGTRQRACARQRCGHPLQSGDRPPQRRAAGVWRSRMGQACAGDR